MTSDQTEGLIRNVCRVDGGVFFTDKVAVDICRMHWYENEVAEAARMHAPLFAAIKAATGFDSEIWQSGGMTMTTVTKVDDRRRYLGLVERFDDDGTLQGSCSYFEADAAGEWPDEETSPVLVAYANPGPGELGPLTPDAWAARIAEHSRNLGTADATGSSDGQ